MSFLNSKLKLSNLFCRHGESSKYIENLEEKLTTAETSLQELQSETSNLKEKLNEKTDELTKRCSQSGYLEEELSRDNTRLLERFHFIYTS